MLESSLSHHESSGTSKVSVITEALTLIGGKNKWVGKQVNAWMVWLSSVLEILCTFSTSQLWKGFVPQEILFTFFFCIYIYIFSDHDFLLSASFSLSCSFSRKVSHLVELKTNISVLYNITTLFWLMKSSDFLYLLLKKLRHTGCITKHCQVCQFGNQWKGNNILI